MAGKRVNPGTHFLDEPIASVDEENTAIIETIIGNLKKDGRTMVVMTTHDRDQAARLAYCLLIMKEGRIEKAGEGIKNVEAGFPCESMLYPPWWNKGFEKEECSL